MKETKHFHYIRDYFNKSQSVYLCNWAVSPKKEKLTKDEKEVTCKNCLRILNNVKDRFVINKNDTTRLKR